MKVILLRITNGSGELYEKLLGENSSLWIVRWCQHISQLCMLTCMCVCVPSVWVTLWSLFNHVLVMTAVMLALFVLLQVVAPERNSVGKDIYWLETHPAFLPFFQVCFTERINNCHFNAGLAFLNFKPFS